MTAGGSSPARVYDERFVPALFGPWGARVADAADIRTGARVLDVACGTGALTLEAAARSGPDGEVVGLDASEEMLAVARAKPLGVTWMQGVAESLPFPDDRFDRVVSQFGLMFFDDPVRALREMMRVLRPGGRLAVAVCDAVDASPGYAVLTELLHRLFGPAVADAFRAPFTLGDLDRLRALAAEAGLRDAHVARHPGQVRFASIEALVATERACAWTLGGMLDDVQFRRLQEAAGVSLRPFVQGDGQIVFDMPALVVTASKL